MYKFRNKLVRLSKSVQETVNNKNTSLPQNLSIFCKLQIRYVL